MIEDGDRRSSILNPQSSLLLRDHRLTPYHHYPPESSRITGLRHDG
jgi:hypothetical protein